MDVDEDQDGLEEHHCGAPRLPHNPDHGPLWHRRQRPLLAEGLSGKFHSCQPWPTNNPLHASSLCCLDTEMIIDHRYSKWTVQCPADLALNNQSWSKAHRYSLSFIEYQVNLNYSAEVCGNLTLDIHNETQVVMATATVLMLLTALYPRRRPRSMSPQFKLTTACSRICLLLYLSFLLVSSRSFTYYLLGAIEMTKLLITSHCKRGERE